MASLMIKDLAHSEEMSAKEMGAVRGGWTNAVLNSNQNNSFSNSLVNIDAPVQTVIAPQLGFIAASPGALLRQQ